MQHQDYPYTAHVNAIAAACDIQNVLSGIHDGTGADKLLLENALEKLEVVIERLELDRRRSQR
jgi:hypothetical protein